MTDALVVPIIKKNVRGSFLEGLFIGVFLELGANTVEPIKNIFASLHNFVIAYITGMA